MLTDFQNSFISRKKTKFRTRCTWFFCDKFNNSMAPSCQRQTFKMITFGKKSSSHFNITHYGKQNISQIVIVHQLKMKNMYGINLISNLMVKMFTVSSHASTWSFSPIINRFLINMHKFLQIVTIYKNVDQTARNGRCYWVKVIQEWIMFKIS